MRVNRPFLGAVVLCAFSLTYPLVAQGPQDRRDNPQARPGGQQGGNAGRPDAGAGRPTPGGGNNGRPQVQPARPNPGNQRPACAAESWQSATTDAAQIVLVRLVRHSGAIGHRIGRRIASGRTIARI